MNNSLSTLFVVELQKSVLIKVSADTKADRPVFFDIALYLSRD
jgi:hypothetical protein